MPVRPKLQPSQPSTPRTKPLVCWSRTWRPDSWSAYPTRRMPSTCSTAGLTFGTGDQFSFAHAHVRGHLPHHIDDGVALDGRNGGRKDRRALPGWGMDWQRVAFSAVTVPFGSGRDRMQPRGNIEAAVAHLTSTLASASFAPTDPYRGPRRTS